MFEEVKVLSEIKEDNPRFGILTPLYNTYLPDKYAIIYFSPSS